MQTELRQIASLWPVWLIRTSMPTENDCDGELISNKEKAEKRCKELNYGFNKPLYFAYPLKIFNPFDYIRLHK